MTREDEELLLELSRISKDSSRFALGVLKKSISRDDQIAFGYCLVDLAEPIRERALRTAGLIMAAALARRHAVIFLHNERLSP
ncbi:MAG: hypothetical protein ACRDSZ_03300 [Pseudonocardiaceae bacterium]